MADTMTGAQKMKALLRGETVQLKSCPEVEARLRDNGYVRVVDTLKNKVLDPDSVFECSWKIKPKEVLITRDDLAKAFMRYIDEKHFCSSVGGVLRF